VGKTIGDTTGRYTELTSLVTARRNDFNTIPGNLGKTVSNTTSGLGKTVGDTTGALGRGNISGVASGATGGVGQTVGGAGKGAGDSVEGLGKNVSVDDPSGNAIEELGWHANRDFRSEAIYPDELVGRSKVRQGPVSSLLWLTDNSQA
jgi:hypothetical protein